MAKQMPGVVIRDITSEDLKDPNLSTLNEYLREAATAANIMAGAHGDVPLTSDLDLQGNQIKNVGAVTAAKLAVNGAAPTVPAGQLGLGSGTAAAATAGAATLPAHPVGFLVLNLGGVTVKVPYYAT
jgi:hypothetical protein